MLSGIILPVLSFTREVSFRSVFLLTFVVPSLPSFLPSFLPSLSLVAAGVGGAEEVLVTLDQSVGGVLDVVCSLSVGGKEDELNPLCYLD